MQLSRRSTALLFTLAACGGDPTDPPSRTAARIEAVSAISQRGPFGEPANAPPAVRAVDGNGTPVPGVVVTFSATGGSVVAPATVTTDQNGIARSTSWQLAAGPVEATASVPGLVPVVFSATGHPRGFDLTIRWLTPPTAEAQAAVAAAEATIEAVIWEDLPGERVDATPVCNIQGVPSATIDEDIDDVLILASVGPIDGPGGLGAQGFPCLIRDPGTQTIVGRIRFDEAEFAAIDQSLKREFALHELVHALGLIPGVINITTPTGFARSCLRLPSTGAPNVLVQDSHFSCAGAVAGFDRIGGDRYTGPKVPLENGATRSLGPNTLNHHWRKTSLRHELMTGWFVLGIPAPLSLVTVGALEDLDYGVSYAAAEPFVLDGAIATGPAATSARQVFPGEIGEIPAPVVHRSVPARRR